MHKMLENNMFSKLGQSNKQSNFSPAKNNKTSQSPEAQANKSELFLPSASLLGKPLLFHKQSRNEVVYNS